MLTTFNRRFTLLVPKLITTSTRLQSTQSQPHQGQETTQVGSSTAFFDKLQQDMQNLGPLSDAQQQELEAIFDSQSSFSVFPSLKVVNPEEVKGFVPFGKKSYFVQRTSKGNLPVYSDFRNSNKIVTEIRRIQGDAVQLRNDLQERLPFIPKKYWKVILQSNKIIIEGDATKHVKRVLATTF